MTSLVGEAKGVMKDAVLFGVHADRLASTVRLKDNVLSFHGLEGDVYGGKASGTVSFNLPVPKEYSVDITFENADSEPVQKLVGIKWLPLPKGKVEGNFKTSGNKFKPNGRFSFNAVKGREDPFGRVQTIRGSYSLEDKVLALKDINARSSEAHLFFSGSTDLGSGGLDFEGYMLSTDINSHLSPYFKRLNGGGRVDAKVSGTRDAPQVAGKVELWDARLDDYMFGSVLTDFSMDRTGLLVPGLTASSGETVHAAVGVIRFQEGDRLMPEMNSLEYDLTVNAENGDLGALVSFIGLGSRVEGLFDADVAFKGMGKTPVIEGKAVVEAASIYGRRVDKGAFRFSYSDREFSLWEGRFREGDSLLKLDGAVSLDRDFTFAASSNNLSLRNVFAGQYDIDYTARLKISGDGTFDEPEISLEGDLKKGSFRNYPLWDSSIKGSLSGRQYEIDVHIMDGKSDIALNGSLEGQMPWKADVKVEYGRYDFLLGPFMKDPPGDLVLGLQGKASLWGDRNTLNADADIEKALLNAYGQGFNILESTRLKLRGRVLEIPGVRFRGGTSAFSVSGSAEIGSAMDLKIKGHASLAPLPLFLPILENVKGSAELDLAVSGKWGLPELYGTLRVKDGSLSFKDRPQRITGINGALRFADGRVVADELVARLGGGNVKAAGQLMLEGIKVTNIRVDLALSDISYYVSRNFIASIGGNVLVTGNASNQKVSGELWVDKALYSERTDWKSWLVTGGVRRPRKIGDWRRGVDLNLRVFGARNIKVVNNIADASLGVDLVIRGTLDSPLLLGRIESDEGKFFFRNTQFRIIRATADYADVTSTAPFISIRAQSSVGGYFIWLTLEGKMDQMDLTLSSDPPLDDVEILGLLTLGGAGGSLDGLEGGIGAAEATSLLTGQVQDVVEERFTDITGLDRVQIAPSVSRETGSVVPRVTVSKRLLGDKLYLTYSSTLGDENEQEMSIEYILGENISLVGGQEDTGSIGGDLKFRFRFE
ncbi:MAG TPA: hypothetical protein ENI12_06345 [Nitrospirae bacterium]|nr:hypothetical protein [Nitrospirota bacterium]